MPYLGKNPEKEIQQQSAPITTLGSKIIASTNGDSVCGLIGAAKQTDLTSSITTINQSISNLSDTVSQNAITAQRLYSPGDFVFSISSTAPTGTVATNGATIGSANSNATGRANSDTIALFTVLWNSTTNTDLPIQTSTGAASTRGLNAVADFAANKRLPLPNIQDGEALIAAVTSAVGSKSIGAILQHNHDITINGVGDHTHNVAFDQYAQYPGDGSGLDVGHTA